MIDLFDAPAEPEEIADTHDGIRRCAWCDRPATTTASTIYEQEHAACDMHARFYGHQPRKEQ